MSLFNRDKNQKNINSKIKSNIDSSLKLSLLNEKIASLDDSQLDELEKIVKDSLSMIKSENDKIIWNLYIPYYIDANEYFRKIDCLYIRGDKIFIFECEDFRECIEFKEINSKIWRFEYFTDLRLDQNPIFKANETAMILSEFLNLNSLKNIFHSSVVLMGANSSKNIFENNNNIYIKNGHRKSLKTKLEDIINNNTSEYMLSEKWILKICEKLLIYVNPNKKIIKKYKKQSLQDKKV